MTMNGRTHALLAGAPLLAACLGAPSAPAVAATATVTRTCTAAHLKVTPGMAMGTSVTIYQILDFRNTGRVSCVLDGYPRVWFGRGKPAVTVGLAAADDRSAPRRLITLRPGATAGVLLQIADATPGCRGVYAPYLIVYPPGSRTRVVVGYGTTACTRPVRQLTVGPIQRNASL